MSEDVEDDELREIAATIDWEDPIIADGHAEMTFSPGCITTGRRDTPDGARVGVRHRSEGQVSLLISVDAGDVDADTTITMPASQASRLSRILDVFAATADQEDAKWEFL